MLRRLWLALALLAVSGLAMTATAGAGAAQSSPVSWVMLGPVHVRIVDFFELSGSGPAAGIHSHFIAIASEADFVPLHLFGDPFNCDPI
jgi:hypothetical protein